MRPFTWNICSTFVDWLRSAIQYLSGKPHAIDHLLENVDQVPLPSLEIDFDSSACYLPKTKYGVRDIIVNGSPIGELELFFICLIYHPAFLLPLSSLTGYLPSVKKVICGHNILGPLVGPKVRYLQCIKVLFCTRLHHATKHFDQTKVVTDQPSTPMTRFIAMDFLTFLDPINTIIALLNHAIECYRSVGSNPQYYMEMFDEESRTKGKHQFAEHYVSQNINSPIWCITAITALCGLYLHDCDPWITPDTVHKYSKTCAAFMTEVFIPLYHDNRMRVASMLQSLVSPLLPLFISHIRDKMKDPNVLERFTYPYGRDGIDMCIPNKIKFEPEAYQQSKEAMQRSIQVCNKYYLSHRHAFPIPPSLTETSLPEGFLDTLNTDSWCGDAPRFKVTTCDREYPYPTCQHDQTDGVSDCTFYLLEVLNCSPPKPCVTLVPMMSHILAIYNTLNHDNNGANHNRDDDGDNNHNSDNDDDDTHIAFDMYLYALKPIIDLKSMIPEIRWG